MVSARTRVINGALALAVAGAVTAAVLVVGDPASGRRSTGRTATVRTGTVTATVTTSGTVQSATQDAVSFQQSGTVTAIYVKVGQKVAAGAKLAAIDATTQQLAVNAAQASLQAAQYGLASAEAGTPVATARPTSRTTSSPASPSASRPASRPAPSASSSPTPSPTPSGTPSPSPTPSVTPSATDSAGSHVQAVVLRIAAAPTPTPSVNPQQVAQAQAQVYQAQAQLAQAQKALDQTVLTAPVAGTVQAINGSVGGASGGTGSGSASASSGGGASSTGTSSSGSSSSSGFVVLTDLARLQVKGEVAEADIAKVQVGQPVSYTFTTATAPAGSGDTLTGSVQAIDVTATVSSNVVEYGVTMSIDDPPSGLRLGQTATAAIQTGSVDGALFVPSTAITTVGSRSTVTVQDGKGTRIVPVTLGLAGDTDTQITSGLSDGQTVVLPTTTTTGGTGTARFPGLGGGGLGGLGR